MDCLGPAFNHRRVAMKKLIAASLGAACLASLAVAALPPPPKVQVTAVMKKAPAGQSAVGPEGSRAKKTENATYTLTLKNISFEDLPSLTVDYILFVERQKIAQKKSDPPVIERLPGSLNVDGLKRGTSQAISTKEISLNTENLVGNYHYINGGRIRAEDAVVGVWVRVSQEGQLVGEYAVPSTVTARGWDAK